MKDTAAKAIALQKYVDGMKTRLTKVTEVNKRQWIEREIRKHEAKIAGLLGK